jgi:hypothetical protein
MILAYVACLVVGLVFGYLIGQQAGMERVKAICSREGDA